MNLGPTELVIILVILLLLFGAKKLPDLAGSMGKSIKEFKKATDESDDEVARAETTSETTES
jgi:sec-independent protein translocase protein TatA